MGVAVQESQRPNRGLSLGRLSPEPHKRRPLGRASAAGTASAARLRRCRCCDKLRPWHASTIFCCVQPVWGSVWVRFWAARQGLVITFQHFSLQSTPCFAARPSTLHCTTKGGRHRTQEQHPCRDDAGPPPPCLLLTNSVVVAQAVAEAAAPEASQGPGAARPADCLLSRLLAAVPTPRPSSSAAAPSLQPPGQASAPAQPAAAHAAVLWLLCLQGRQGLAAGPAALGPAATAAQCPSVSLPLSSHAWLSGPARAAAPPGEATGARGGGGRKQQEHTCVGGCTSMESCFTHHKRCYRWTEWAATGCSASACHPCR